MGDQRLKQVYDDMSAIYDSKRTKEYFDKLVAYLTAIIPKGSKVLEIGSGTGGYSIELSRHGCACRGVDYSEKMVAVSQKNNRAANARCVFKVADVEKEIPFKEQFDFVISMDSWEFFPDPSAVMQNVSKVLKRDGFFVIFTPNMLFAPAIILAEKLKIKKLSPAYTYFNSFKHRVKRWASQNGFEYVARDKIFHGLTVIYVLRKK
jgi:SAM-dependent methyltransferase